MRAGTRGLKRLKTLSDRAGEDISSYRSYLRLSYLALERARRTIEKRSAQARIELLGAQVDRLEEEERNLLGELGLLQKPAPAERGLAPVRGSLRFRY